jgi:hypothetical protein
MIAKRPRSKAPQDLSSHACIDLRLPTAGGLYAWEFDKGGRELKVRVEGQLAFNGSVSARAKPDGVSSKTSSGYAAPRIASASVARRR